MFTFKPGTQFYNDHKALILQYEQTQRVLSDRLARYPGASATTDAIKKNLEAQVYSLFKKTLLKDGDHYRYADVLFENLDAFEEKYGKATKFVAPSLLRDAMLIKVVRQHCVKYQAELFQRIHKQSISRDYILQCGININDFRASKTDAKIDLFKYDSLLHFAARIGNIDAIGLLLEMGSDINSYKPAYKYTDTKNKTINTTPLGVAIASDNTRAARVLLEAGARVDMKEFPNLTYYQAITVNIKSADMEMLLMEYTRKQVNETDSFASDTSFTFTERMLIEDNKRLRASAEMLNNKIDEVIALVKPAINHAPSFFAQPFQPAIDEVNRGEPVAKKIKSMGVD
tara:strand:- start:2514 stop:3542 length:1029 start_codon:yes stop_codon:yes gene_type:complete